MAKAQTTMELIIDVKPNITLLDAIKLRIAGGAYSKLLDDIYDMIKTINNNGKSK